MYLYFDKKGVLKEVINDNPIRQSEVGNLIYIYIEEFDYTGVTVSYKYQKPTGQPIVEASEYSIKYNEYVPYNARRDLKFFDYSKPYTFLVIPTSYDEVITEPEPSEVHWNALTEPGVVALSVYLTGNSNISVLGLITFNVEYSVDNILEIQETEYISLAQWNYLKIKLAEMNANIKGTVRILTTLPADASDYQDGEVFYVLDTKRLYVINSGNFTFVYSFKAISITGTSGSLLDYIGVINSNSDVMLERYVQGSGPSNPSRYEYYNFKEYNNVTGDRLYERYDLSTSGTDITITKQVITVTSGMAWSLSTVSATTLNKATINLKADKTYVDTFAKNLTFDNYTLTLTDGSDNTITEIVLPFNNYYTKLETQDYVTNYAYSKDDIDRIISTIKADELQVVNELPQTGEEGIIYLVPISSDPSDGYYRYIWENNSWLNLGTTEIDLSNKLDKLTTTGTYVYTHNGSTQGEIALLSNPIPNIAVLRDLAGGILVPDTIADNTEAINANYANSTYVKRTLTIAGIDLQNNISAQNLTDALVFMNTTTDIDYVMGD